MPHQLAGANSFQHTSGHMVVRRVSTISFLCMHILCMSVVIKLFRGLCRKGKRSALVDHQSKNKEHKQLVAEMESGLKHVMLMAGTAQRLLGKVAIITGDPFF